MSVSKTDWMLKMAAPIISDNGDEAVCLIKYHYKGIDEVQLHAKSIAKAPQLLETLQKWCVGFEWNMESKKETLDKSDYQMYDEAMALIKEITDDE